MANKKVEFKIFDTFGKSVVKKINDELVSIISKTRLDLNDKKQRLIFIEYLYHIFDDEEKIVQYKVTFNKELPVKINVFIVDVYFKQKNCIKFNHIRYTITQF